MRVASTPFWSLRPYWLPGVRAGWYARVVHHPPEIEPWMQWAIDFAKGMHR
jgi:hypothetical protein